MNFSKLTRLDKWFQKKFVDRYTGEYADSVTLIFHNKIRNHAYRKYLEVEAENFSREMTIQKATYYMSTRYMNLNTKLNEINNVIEKNPWHIIQLLKANVLLINFFNEYDRNCPTDCTDQVIDNIFSDIVGPQGLTDAQIGTLDTGLYLKEEQLHNNRITRTEYETARAFVAIQIPILREVNDKIFSIE